MSSAPQLHVRVPLHYPEVMRNHLQDRLLLIVLLALSACSLGRPEVVERPEALRIAGTDAGNPLVSQVQHVGTEIVSYILSCPSAATLAATASRQALAQELLSAAYLDSTLGEQFGYRDSRATSSEMIDAELSQAVYASPEGTRECLAAATNPNGPAGCGTRVMRSLVSALTSLIVAAETQGTTTQLELMPEYAVVRMRIEDYFTAVNIAVSTNAFGSRGAVCTAIFSF